MIKDTLLSFFVLFSLSSLASTPFDLFVGEYEMVDISCTGPQFEDSDICNKLVGFSVRKDRENSVYICDSHEGEEYGSGVWTCVPLSEHYIEDTDATHSGKFTADNENVVEFWSVFDSIQYGKNEVKYSWKKIGNNRFLFKKVINGNGGPWAHLDGTIQLTLQNSEN